MVSIAVLGHRGMLGRRVMERFPDAITFEERWENSPRDPLLRAIKAASPGWIINCIGVTEGRLWETNAALPQVIQARGYRLIQPSTDHVHDATPYALSKRGGEVGHVIRCAIVDPEGGMLARARAGDTVGETRREWNGITARAWADVAADIIEDRCQGFVVPGSPTISHYGLLETARLLFDWPTRTLRDDSREWRAEAPTLLLPPIEEQLAAYL